MPTRSRMRCKKNSQKLLEQPAKTSLSAAFFAAGRRWGDRLRCQFVVKMLSKRKTSASLNRFPQIDEHGKSQISRASSMAATTVLIEYIRQHLPFLLGARSTIQRKTFQRIVGSFGTQLPSYYCFSHFLNDTRRPSKAAPAAPPNSVSTRLVSSVSAIIP